MWPGVLTFGRVRTHVPIITYVCLVMGIYPSGALSVPGQMTRSARRARKGGKDRNRHNDFNGLTTGREVRRMVRHTVGGKGHVLLLVLASLLVIALPAGGLAALIDEQVLRTEVAAGIDLIKIRRFDEAGWLNIFALEIDRTNPHVYIDTLLGHGILTEPQEVSVMARERGAVGAVNGDFFYINTSGAPIGPHVQSGEPVKSGSAGRHLGIGFPEDPALPPVMLPFTLQVEAELPDGSLLRVDGSTTRSSAAGRLSSITNSGRNALLEPTGPTWPASPASCMS